MTNPYRISSEPDPTEVKRAEIHEREETKREKMRLANERRMYDKEKRAKFWKNNFPLVVIFYILSVVVVCILVIIGLVEYRAWYDVRYPDKNVKSCMDSVINVEKSLGREEVRCTHPSQIGKFDGKHFTCTCPKDAN